MTEPSPREAAALDAARRALDMLSFDLAALRYDLMAGPGRSTFLPRGGLSGRARGPYLERAFQRGLHDRFHSYEALPDEYVGNNADLIADAYLIGGDVAKRLETLAQVLDAVVKQKGNTLAHRVQHAFALWGASRANDARVRKVLASVRNAPDDVRASLDTAYPKARCILAVIEGDADEAARWLAAYDALLPTEPGTQFRRVHLITLTFWLIARDRYAMTLPTADLPGLPDAIRAGDR